jgi:hypothetical protein
LWLILYWANPNSSKLNKARKKNDMGWGKLIYPKKLSGPKLMGWSEKTAP